MSELTPASFRTAQFRWTLENQGGAAIEVDLTQEQAALWVPPQRIIVRGEHDWIGEINHLERAGKPIEIGVGDNKVGWKVSGLGLFAARLNKRIVRHDLVVNDTVDVIVEALLSEAQDNQFNGPMGLEMGSTIGSFATRRRGYCVGIRIGDAIRELASMDRGFDFEIDADGRLNMWAPNRGVDTGRTLSETQCQLFEPVLDTAEMLTNVTAIADPSDPFGPKYRMSRTAKAITYGRREDAIDTDIIALNEENPDWEDELYDVGRGLLRQYGGGFFTLHTRWDAHAAPWSLADVWLQDSVAVEMPDGPFRDALGDSVDMRVTEVMVTLEAMPPRGDRPPIYWVDYWWDALVRDIDMEDGDPDQES
jgi:hypothetical protein